MAGVRGKSGRKPKLQKAKDLAGTYRPDREKPRTNEVKLGLPLLTRETYCPVHIQGEARKAWGRVSRLLAEMEVLTRAALPALEVYCILYARWKEAEAQIAKDGLTIDGGGSTGRIPIPSPYVRISDDCMRQMRMWLGELKLTPASQPGWTKPKAAEEVVDPKELELDEYFFGRRN